MRKITLKFLKELKKDGYAKEIKRECDINPNRIVRIGYSVGMYGCNGLWFTDLDSGNDYVIIGRKSILWKYI